MAGVDLITDILAKLPVKSLLRFNCVSKTWYSIISDPQFCNNLHSMRQPCVLMSENFREFSTIKIESLLGSDDEKPIITPIFLPWQTRETKKSYHHMILGSCNGLVCLYYRSYVEEQSGLILWNPSTRKFKKLSDPPGLYWINFQPPSCTCVWFGYDELIDDYKLVLLSCEDASCTPPQISKLYVFTLKSNMWRRCAVDHIALGHLTRFFQKYKSYSCHSIGVLSNRTIHWVKPDYIRSNLYTEECILALDLATEKVGLLIFSHNPSFEVYPWIGSLPGRGGGCLCLCTYDYVGCRRSVMALWIMKEYGVESSWTRVLFMNGRGFPYVKFFPILFSKKGKEIVAISQTSYYHAKMVKLRVSGEKVRSEKTLLCFKKEHYENNVFLHMEESLVSLN